MEFRKMSGRIFGIVLYFAVSGAALEHDCNVKADLFFVIDGSDSLSDTDFAASKQFMIEVLREFDVQLDRIHMGANVFGTDVYDRIPLHGPNFGKNENFAKMKYKLLEKRMQILRRVRSGTATYKAIKEMREEFQERGRADVTKVGIVITDGKSVNLNATAQQARSAREEGINIIAIGVGDNIFKQELINIASAPTSIYETDNILDVVTTIQDAIKDYICTPITTTTTSTAAPTTPESDSLKDFDCPDCMIDGKHGYTNHPHSCEKFIQIIADENGKRTYISKKCRDGLFWDQYLSTCRRPEHVKCEHDPCLISGVVSYDIEELCSGYVMCVNKQSVRACCPINHAYVAGKGCVLNPTCMDTCDGDDENHLIHPEVCDKYPDTTDNRKYIQYVEGHGNISMSCPPGTVFNNETCNCDIHDTRPKTGKLDDCNPTANFTFENDFSDTAGGAYVGTQFVELLNGHAQFTGNGLMNIYRFSMDSFAQKLVLRIRFRPSASGKSNEALLTNCVYSEGESSSISIRVVRSSSATTVVFSADTTLETQQVAIPLRNANVWNVATFMYDGSKLYGIIDDGTGPVMVQSAPLTGDILIRKSGVILGAGSQLESYTGDVDEFQLYKCFPAYVEGYRS